MRFDFDVYGTALEPHPDQRNTLRYLGDVAQLAERHGFEGLLSFYNHRNLDPWMVAATLLHTTTTLVPLVAVQPYAVGPLTTAKMVHTLSSLHGRRVDVNLITGAAKEELVQIGDTIDHDQRYARAMEHMQVVSSLLGSNEPFNHDGAHYRFRGLRADAALDPQLHPRVFVAGASEAGRKAAFAVGDVAVTHPEPVQLFAEGFLASHAAAVRAAARQPPRVGIRVGLVARPTSEEAWEFARTQYVADRYTRLKMSMRKKSDSVWSRQMAALATEGDVYDEVYWTGAYRSDQGFAPLLVGDYEQVAQYLAEYLTLGVSTVLLAAVYSEEDFRHVDRVLTLLR
ncbi:LLM class flavin-dependent oxidoreductase [Dactylosporangium matsuzakiense]|uniref:Alkanesulfonate monooxygenase n=1 Tax=Dactylosporangium matsuzakiense TaxID=53360 RepID=A0A9W6NNZ7_9ACTN|nr:LLM class flavin-dependent oxidoreductase [Dactylosporangium matsuzakiense]GLL03746.1 alkanesulfonate monooxygenase [Dactylosporangium matsuzakiense]